MASIIVRLYGSTAQATKAVTELKRKGYAGAPLLLAPGSAVDLTPTIMKAGILKSEAAIYAAGVEKGGTLVIVEAAWGDATAIIEILGDYSPIDSGVSPPPSAGPTWNEQTPFSSAFGLPLLSKDPTPFASFWHIPSVIKSRGPLFGSTISHTTTVIKAPALTRNGWSVSGLLGLPTIR